MDRFKKYRQSEKGKLSLKIRTQRWFDSGKGKVTRDKWVESNKNRIKSYYDKRKSENPLSLLLIYAKSRSKKKNLEFNITKDDLSIPENCPILDIPLFSSDVKLNPNSPSLDRIDSSKGYVKGNVHVISYRANMLKNNGTLEEFKAIVKFLEEIN